MSNSKQHEVDHSVKGTNSSAATSDLGKRVRDAICGLIGTFMLAFVLVAFLPNINRFVVQMPYARELEFVTLVGVAAFAISKTVHAFFVYDWSGDFRTHFRPSRELAKTNQIKN